MLNNKMDKALGLIMLSVLVGCGGSGGSGGSSSAGSTAAQTSVEDTSEDLAAESVTVASAAEAVSTVKMSELQADPNFAFSSKQQVSVSIDLQSLLAQTQQTEQRAYLSVYSDYQQLPSGEFFPTSSSKVLAGELQNGVFEQSFVALNDQQDYLIEVWFYNGDPALQKQQTIKDNRLVW